MRRVQVQFSEAQVEHLEARATAEASTAFAWLLEHDSLVTTNYFMVEAVQLVRRRLVPGARRGPRLGTRRALAERRRLD